MQESEPVMAGSIAPDEARDALEAVTRARQQVASEVGLPRAYWWAMAAAWVVLGVLNELGPQWLAVTVTVLVGAAHATLASRLLDGRRRTGAVLVSRSVAGHRTPAVVIGMLVALVALTVGVALALDADGAAHPAIWAGAVVGAVVGLGGPEMLRTLRRWVRG